MLVYAKEPMGIFNIGQYRIYGRKWGRPPIDIPYKLFKNIQHALEHATYREDYLSRKFGRPVSMIAFTLPELIRMDWGVLHKLAYELGVLSKHTKTQPELYRAIFKALRDVT